MSSSFLIGILYENVAEERLILVEFILYYSFLVFLELLVDLINGLLFEGWAAWLLVAASEGVERLGLLVLGLHDSVFVQGVLEVLWAVGLPSGLGDRQ
jgi:hypothetical protein